MYSGDGDARRQIWDTEVVSNPFAVKANCRNEEGKHGSLLGTNILFDGVLGHPGA